MYFKSGIYIYICNMIILLKREFECIKKEIIKDIFRVFFCIRIFCVKREIILIFLYNKEFIK